MSLNKRLRTAVGNYLFLKKVKQVHRQQKVVNFEDAKIIGLLYDATDEHNYETVRNYVKKIRESRKEVKTLGYIDLKELPENKFAKLGFDFFTKKNLNWSMIPNYPIVTNFTNEKFDILVNLCPENFFPLQYISAVSKAKFKVGKYEPKNIACYDMMLNVNGTISLKNFIEQVDVFLKMVNKK